MQDIIAMSRKELHRAEVVQKLLDKRLTETEAASQLAISVRQIRRLKRSYRELGAPSLVSRKRGKRGNHRYPESFKELVLHYVRSHYADFQPTFACEKLRELHGISISHETLRVWMMEAELWIPRAKRLNRAHQPRYRRECYGELVQIDGSQHAWFEDRGPKCTLLVYIDDATGKLMECQFVATESTMTYFQSTQRYLKRHGKPVAFYSDKHGIFRTNRVGELAGNGVTHFGRALAELNIDIVCANTPQAKGRVERVNRTLQDRLVKEMRLLDISDVDTANAFLPAFMDDFNAKFGKLPLNPKDLHRELKTQDDLNEIFSWQEPRSLSNNLTLQYDKVLYMIQDTPQTRGLARKKVTVHEYQDGSIQIKYEGRSLPYKSFDKLERVDQGVIVDNKRLGNVLAFVRDQQMARDEQRSVNSPSRRHLGLDSTEQIRKRTAASRKRRQL